MTAQQLDDIIIDLGRALQHAQRAKRILVELESDPAPALRTCRTTALVAVRAIARLFPPEVRRRPLSRV
jgi:hypothetical protein